MSERDSNRSLNRRRFLGLAAGAMAAGAAPALATGLGERKREKPVPKPRQPNVLFVFPDQQRAQDANFMGNAQVMTPHLDRLAEQGVTFTHAVSTCPVCTPYRAALLTGRYPLSNGMVLNDVRLPVTERTIAHCLRDAGYRTGYVGKWHLDGHHRGGFTPPGPRRQGFDDFWAVANCTHNYMHSFYFRDEPEPIWIDGYDADHFTDLSVQFIRDNAPQQPWCLFVSWGPPHDPCRLMPEEYLIYDPNAIELRPNATATNREELAGYWSHITALDRCFGRLMAALEETGVAEDTIVVFTSDHGDMLGSQGKQRKQKPWDESIMVPFVLRYPRAVPAGRRTDTLINAPDLMPTLLSLAGLPTPTTVEGIDLAPAARGEPFEAPSSAFIANPTPFVEPIPEWRGVRTTRHTYVRTLEGPWLLYDNAEDPYQMANLVADPAREGLRDELEDELSAWLARLGDDFQPREVLWKRFGYTVDKHFQMPYDNTVGSFED
jgi:arylsulfatase A-like enzyme